MIEIDVNMTFTYTPEALWSMICGSAWESWSWWRYLDYYGGDWDKPCDLWVAVEGPWEDGLLSALVTLPDIVRALEELKDHSVIMECLRNEDFDAVYGDAVMQQAVFGEIIYG